jgi:hypothetical protein
MSTPAICEATRRDGQPCKTPVLGDGRYCFGHDPALAERRAAGSRKGGYRRANALRLTKLMAADIRPIFDLVVDACRQTYAGDMDPKVLSALAAGISAACKAYETGMVEDRLNAIGERLEAKQG